MGFAKAQREQIHVSAATNGTFIPAAAKSNALVVETAGGAGGGTAGAADGDGDVLIAGVSQV